MIWHFKATFSKGGFIESTGYNYIPNEEAVEELKTIFKQQLNDPSTLFVAFVDEYGKPLDEEETEEYQVDPALRPKSDIKTSLPLLEEEEEEE